MNLRNIRFGSTTTMVVMVAVFGLMGAFLLAPTPADAAETGYFYPSYNRDLESIVGHPTWAYSDNGSGADYDSNDTNLYGNFNISIPDGVTVTGVKVVIEGKNRYSNDENDLDIYIHENNASGSWWNTSHKSIDFKTTSWDVDSMGGSNDMWGRVNWTQSELSNGNFVVIVDEQFKGDGSDPEVYIDYVKVKIYHTDPVCGDGYVNQESEDCDDGNNENGDGCHENCTIEPPYLAIYDDPTASCEEISAIVKEYGTGMQTTSTYEVLFSAESFWFSEGVPTNGTVVDSGVINQLNTHETQTLTYNPNNTNGYYMFKVYQVTDTPAFYSPSVQLQGCEPATFIAHKIVCDDETDLPNWADENGPNITKWFESGDAQTWVDQNPNCHFEAGWEFQQEFSNDLGNWTSFGPTDANGMTSLQLFDLKGTNEIRFREVEKTNYIGFKGDNYDDVSAEMLCHTDHKFYDNYDYVRGATLGETYHCVAFNAIDWGTIWGYKFEDKNMDGQFQTLDGKKNNWKIRLYENNNGVKGALVQEVKTGDGAWEDGYYEFTQVMPGKSYIIEEQTKNTWVQTYPKDGNYVVDMEPGMTAEKKDFGNYKKGVVTGYKWNDLNGDGEWDENEPALEGWTIKLWTGNDTTPDTVVDTAVTNSDGKYTFNKLMPGNYYYVSEELQDNWIQTSLPVVWGPFMVTMSGENFPHTQNIKSANFGNRQLFNIHGYKWYDVDGDGLRGEEELLDGWTITLYKDRGLEPYMTTITSSDPDHFGWYWFEDLPAGLYRVCEEPQEGWTQTFPYECHMISLPFGDDQKTTCRYGGEPNAVDAEMECNFGNWMQADLIITKEVDNENAVAGDTLTYTITVENSGDQGVEMLEVVDTLPAEVTLIEGSVLDGGDYTTVPGEITWQIATLDGMSTWSTNFQVTVNELPDGDTTIENLAELFQVEKNNVDQSADNSFFNKLFGINTANAIVNTSVTTRTKIGEDTATTIVTVFGGPFLTIEKDVDATEADAGDTLNYTIVVTNIGDQPAIDVVVDDVLPEGLTYQDGTTEKEWLFDVIASGASETINYVAIIDPEAVSDDYQNIASVTASGLETVQDDAVTSVNEEVSIPVVLGEEALPGLSVDKSVNVTVANPGQTITYTIVVTNTGDALAEDVVLIDHIAPGLQFTDTVAPTHTWMLGDIMAGDSVTTTYDVIVLNDNEPGFYPNTAEVWAAGLDNVYDTVEVEVQTVKVLGAETLPTTGSNTMTFVYLLGAGLVLAFSGLVMKLTVAKK